jgi:hypothetical protein
MSVGKQREDRAATLLRLGSGEPSGSPRPGFDRRLRARIDALEARRPSAWYEALEGIARPGLLAASAVLATTLAIWMLSDATREASLTAFVETDPVLETVLSGRGMELYHTPVASRPRAETEP